MWHETGKLIGMISASPARAKRRNQKRIDKLAQAVEHRKVNIRVNAISKLTLLYPDIALAMGMTSDQFAGYSHARNVFVSGKFLDSHLPDLTWLRDRADDGNFGKHAASFAKDIRDLTFKSDLPDLTPRRLHEKDMRGFLDRNSDAGYTFFDGFLPYDIRIKKNGRLVGRSCTKVPKPIGHFAQKIYEHVVEDTGGRGVSNFSLELFLWNYCDLTEQEITFVYIDTPRRTASQMRDHYIKTCFQFSPFLQAIEPLLHDQSWREDTSFMGFIKTDRERGLL